jgi:hypothetical protein
MKINEIIEGIRMGQKELGAPSKRNYTFGFELEMNVSDFYLDGYGPSKDEILEKMKSDPEVLSDFMTDKVAEYIGIDATVGEITTKVLKILDAKPKSGFKLYNKALVKRNPYADFDVDAVMQEPLETQKEKLLDMAMYYHTKIVPTSEDGDSQLPRIVNSLTNSSRIKSFIESYLKKIARKFPVLDDLKDEDATKLIDAEGELVDVLSNKDNLIHVPWYPKRMRLDSLFGDLQKYFDFSDFIERFQDSFNEHIQDNLVVYTKQQQEDFSKLDYIKNVFEGQINLRAVVSDSSVPDGGEVVSNPYPDLESGLAALKKALDIIRNDDNLITTNQTGLHIGIGTWNGDAYKKIDILKFFTLIDGGRMLADFEREDSRYAQPMLAKMYDALVNQDIKEYNKIQSSMSNNILIKAAKFDFINFSKLRSEGYIEVRAFGNEDYEERFTSIKFYVQKIIRALDIAQDPMAYRNQYMKKLSKFISKETDKSYNRLPPVFPPAAFKDFQKWSAIGNTQVFAGDFNHIEDINRRIMMPIARSNHKKDILQGLNDNFTAGMVKGIRDIFTEHMKEAKDADEFGNPHYYFKQGQEAMRNLIKEYDIDLFPKLHKALKLIYKL